MADMSKCSLEDLVTVEQFSNMFRVRPAWVIEIGRASCRERV